MKKAFTMVELIFVIVIIGILATIAAPKLTATRSDADLVKLINNLSTLKRDIAAYYQINEELPSEPQKISSTFDKVNGNSGYLNYKKENCIKFSRLNSYTYDLMLFYTCKELINNERIVKMLTSTHVCQEGESGYPFNCTKAGEVVQIEPEIGKKVTFVMDNSGLY